MVEEQINDLEQLDDYYNGEYNWIEIIQNFKLTKKFINNNIENLDTRTLLENQDIDLEIIVQNIKFFNIKDVEEFLNIKDPNMIVSLQAKKDEAELKTKEVVVEKELEEELVLDPIEVESSVEEASIESLFEEVKEVVVKEPIVVIETPKVIDSRDGVARENSLTTSSRDDKQQSATKRKSLADIEQLAFDRLKEINVDHTTIVGDYLFKVYLNKYNDLKMKFEFSVNKFDDLILESLNARVA